MPQAVMPPTMGKEVTIPDTLPAKLHLSTCRKKKGIITMNSYSYHEEGDHDVDDIQPHQRVLGAREAPTHFVCKESP